jgi:hypothetical protein
MSLLQSTPPAGASATREATTDKREPTASGVIDARRARDEAIINDAKATTEAREAEVQAEAHAEEGRRSGLSWEQALAEAPPHVQTLMKNMRADYTRKTQEVASERKALTAEREALLKSGTLDKLRAKAAEDTGEFNPFDDASVAARIEQEVARRLHDALAPLEQEHKQAQARQEYQTFLEKNPDLKTDPEVRRDVYDALKKNPALDLESAYFAVKGRRLSSVEAQREARKQAEREAARAAALTATASGKRAGTPTIDTDAVAPRKPGERMDAWAVYQELKRQAR